MSPLTHEELPLHPNVTVEDASDDEYVPHVVKGCCSREADVVHLTPQRSTMSYLSELRAGNPEIALPPLSSPLLEPSAFHHRHDGRLRSPGPPRSSSSRTRSPTSKTQGSKSKSRERGRRDGRERHPSGTDSVLTFMLVEEERNSSNLRALLQLTRDRLETETRRADAAESRATMAEARTREVTSRAATAEQAQHRCELDTARAQEETKRVQMQMETSERELRRVTNELQRLTRQKEEAETAAAKARDLARKYQSTLRDHQAHEEGRQEGIRLALLRRYDDGREDGWEEGHTEGWDAGREEGFVEGRKTGFEEGHEMGRREVRRYAGPQYERWKEAPSPRHFEEVDDAVIPDRSLFGKSRSEVRSLLDGGSEYSNM
jgi:flagellar biosynthesis/type III secretory pathway protein FliH